MFLFLQGLIVSSREESLQHFKKPWAHDHEPVTELVDAVNVRFLCLLFSDTNNKYTTRESTVSNFSRFMFSFQIIKPTVLIGTSGQGQTFTQEVVEAMASHNEVLCQPIHQPNMQYNTCT